MKPLPILTLLFVFAFLISPAHTQTAVETATLAAMSNSALERMPAKKLFGSQKLPAGMAPRAIGTYAKGCLAGAKSLPMEGPNWEVMRPSRNRNWAHPAMVSLIQKLAGETKQYDGWNGLLVGDIAQPRGGPMSSGHASHQVGLDADIWLTPMPDRVLSSKERETMSAVNVVKGRRSIDKKVWTEAHARLIKRAASYAEVARIFVHPPIKAELCKWASGDRSWLSKVRPYFGHTYHFHIRIKCPDGSTNCKNQGPARPKDGTGCGTELAYWMGDIPWRKPKPVPHGKRPKPAPLLTLRGLPAECRAVVTAQ